MIAARPAAGPNARSSTLGGVEEPVRPPGAASARRSLATAGDPPQLALELLDRSTSSAGPRGVGCPRTSAGPSKADSAWAMRGGRRNEAGVREGGQRADVRRRAGPARRACSQSPDPRRRHLRGACGASRPGVAGRRTMGSSSSQPPCAQPAPDAGLDRLDMGQRGVCQERRAAGRQMSRAEEPVEDQAGVPDQLNEPVELREAAAIESGHVDPTVRAPADRGSLRG